LPFAPYIGSMKFSALHIVASALVLGLALTPPAPASAEGAAVPEPPPVAAKPKPIDTPELLDSLLGRLRLADSDEQAKLIEHGVWQIWSRSGSPTADLLVVQAMKAAEAGQTIKALAMLDTVIASRPQFTEAWNKRATVYFLIGDYDRSLADIEKVLEMEPRHFGALAGQGLIFNEQGKPEAAIRALKRALAINPRLDAARKALKEIEPNFERDI
jgi:tetratricopeptide (TPR) repeat protein